MNCKPGDLAIIVRDPTTVLPRAPTPPEMFGRQVRCRRFKGAMVASTSAVNGGLISISDAWEIEPISFQDLLIDCYPDSALMPIRPEPESESEKREEALRA